MKPLPNPIERFVQHLYGYRTPILLVVHSILIVAANQFAFWLRFDGAVPPEQQPYNTSLLPLLLLTRLTVFYAMRLHRGVWRYASVWDLRNILVAVIVSSTLFWVITHGLLAIMIYPRSVFVIDAVLLICLLGGLRFARRLHAASSGQGRRRVLIYGAGDAGELIVRDMLHSDRFDVTPIGFVDDDERKVGQYIHGVRVLGSRSHLSDILQKHAPDELLIAIPSASPKTLRALVRVLEPFKIRITTLPRLHDLIESNIEVGQIRQLKVEDLLARAPVGLDYLPVRQFLAGRRVLVTGAGGSIGAELSRQIAQAHPNRLMLLDRHENSLFHIQNELRGRFTGVKVESAVADITDVSRIDQLFDLVRPDIVFHAAAHKHVPLMEDNPCEAVKNNVRGTRIVAECAIRAGVERFVLISTDKAVNPISVMGATKRVAEQIVERLGRTSPTRFVTVRFGNVLGSNGSVVPTFVEQIANGGPVTVTHPEMKRFFMLIPEAVQLVLHAAALRDLAPLYVLEMGEQIRVTDMARDLIRLAGLVPDEDIEIRFIGLRPGEKLYEELVGEDEIAEPSSREKILCVRARGERSTERLQESLSRLEALALDGRQVEVLSELRLLTSGFNANRESSPA
jgi:FlaA1/EpsC-like NDP-sugar epimerase